MTKKSTFIIIVIILLLVAGGVYWYLFFYGPGNVITPVVTGNRPSTGFMPFSTSSSTPTGNNGGEPIGNGSGGNQNPSTTSNLGEPIPSLRLLSNTPIGGYGASTTASTTIVRWVDRGRGNVYEAVGDSLSITTLSNTILPKTYYSVWNKNLTSFIGSILSSESDIPTVVYAELKKRALSTSSGQATSTASNQTNGSTETTTPTNRTPYELKGKNLPEGMISYAVSPKGDKVFMLIKESGNGVGYTADFDGTKVTKIFSTPLTQVNVEWPEETTIAITTKGSAGTAGFLYFVNTKTGVWKKMLGPTYGLSTKVSHDAKYFIASGSSKNQGITTNIYSVGTTTPLETTIRTIADKCVWGNYYKEIIYCAVPSQPESATYPDDWYKGTVSFTDKIWQVNVKNGDTRLVSNIYDQSDRIIDAYNLGLDSRDDFLFFMNKNDLSFWSFDLNAR